MQFLQITHFHKICNYKVQWTRNDRIFEIIIERRVATKTRRFRIKSCSLYLWLHKSCAIFTVLARFVSRVTKPSLSRVHAECSSSTSRLHSDTMHYRTLHWTSWSPRIFVPHHVEFSWAGMHILSVFQAVGDTELTHDRLWEKLINNFVFMYQYDARLKVEDHL